MGDQKLGFGSVLAMLLAGGWLLHQCDGGSPADSAESAPTKVTTSSPPPHKTIPGDGYHNFGGIDGKDWGVWRSTGSARECAWSIRLTSPYSGATVLREGHAAPGQSTRASVQPPGNVSSISGEINGGRVVFQTSGCGSWTLES